MCIIKSIWCLLNLWKRTSSIVARLFHVKTCFLFSVQCQWLPKIYNSTSFLNYIFFAWGLQSARKREARVGKTFLYEYSSIAIAIPNCVITNDIILFLPAVVFADFLCRQTVSLQKKHFSTTKHAVGDFHDLSSTCFL